MIMVYILRRLVGHDSSAAQMLALITLASGAFSELHAATLILMPNNEGAGICGSQG